jgi:putative ABC transport system permease protein
MISLVLVNLSVYLVNMVSIIRIKNCYDTKSVILINIEKKNEEEPVLTEQSFMNLKKVIGANTFVEFVSISNNAIPYNYSVHSTDFMHDSDRFNLSLREVDIDYAKVMKVTPLKGRWFDESDLGKAIPPIIVSREIDEKYFNGDALGKKITEDKKEYEIVGIVERFKRSDIESPQPCGFRFNEKVKAREYWGSSILIRTRDNMTEEMLAVAESQVYSTINPENWTIQSLNAMENMRNRQNSDSYQRNYLSVIIALFIIINVFLGTIGILWYNTNLRIHEIGIKRALGSTGSGIKRTLITENLIIAGLGLLVVILIMIQIPVPFLRRPPEPGVFSAAIRISVVSMILLVLLSTWIPASLAAKIRPATALKTE